MPYRPVMLMILDGFGHCESTTGNAVAMANTPVIDGLFNTWPHTLVTTSGRAVGLPDGVMGNSEVGHLNIGAGRVVRQEVMRITESIENGSFFEKDVLVEAFKHAGSDHKVHLMGLVSDGKVHSSDNHYLALVDMAKKMGLAPDQLMFHVFLDGRDTPPTSGIGYVKQLHEHMQSVGVGRIATIGGRYWAMDRDKRWDRVQKHYRALTLGEGVEESSDPIRAMRGAYDKGQTDEFVEPMVLGKTGPDTFDGRIENGDTVIFFNFRGDRARQISHAFVDDEFDGFEREVHPDVHYVCFTQYEDALDAPIAFLPQPPMKNILGQVVSEAGLRQLRIAETEKYAHVTFFFNGGEETPFEGEDRELIPSPKVATYDLQPEMSAYPVTDKVVEAIGSGAYDLIVLNFANLDMVGHTGIVKAAVKAAEAVDACVGRVVKAIEAAGGAVLITADHGNAEEMFHPSGESQTQHTTNRVPLIYIAPGKTEVDLRDDAALCDLAPTLLELMQIDKPEDMEGTSVVK